MKYLANVVTLAYDEGKCTGCKRCEEVCPRGVFIVNGKKAAITDRNLCIECGACMQNCAFGAITVDSGVGCASALIGAMITGGEPVCGCCDDGSSGGSGCC